MSTQQLNECKKAINTHRHWHNLIGAGELRHAHTICHQLYFIVSHHNHHCRRHLNFSIFLRNYLGISLITRGMLRRDEQCWLWMKLSVSHAHNFYDCVGVDLFLKHFQENSSSSLFCWAFIRVRKIFLLLKMEKFNNLRNKWLLSILNHIRVELIFWKIVLVI